MASELALVLINPYTISKSRTGGVIGRFLSRTGLEMVATRMFGPSYQLCEKFADIIRNSSNIEQPIRDLLAGYVMKSYAPDPVTGRARRVMMLLLEGEDAIQKVKDVAGSPVTGGGESIRDTFGDYVTDENGVVTYFEPAVLVGSSREETAATLKLWSEYSVSDGGLIENAMDVSRTEGWEKTLVLIKPDNFRFPNSRPGNIIDLLSRSGLRIIASKIHRMSVQEAEEFYGPVRSVLCNKLAKEVGERSANVLAREFSISIPDNIKNLLGEQLCAIYGEEQFNQIVKFMTGIYPPNCSPEDKANEGQSKCLALVYCGVNAVNKIRDLLGPTDPSKAQLGSVRREFGHDIMVNAAHASDSIASATREIGIIHPEEDLISGWFKRCYGGK